MNIMISIISSPNPVDTSQPYCIVLISNKISSVFLVFILYYCFNLFAATLHIGGHSSIRNLSNNKEQYFTNSEIHHTNTRHTSNLHSRRTHLNIYQKGVYYSGIKIFNSLPRDIKTYNDNLRTFKKAVQNFLYTNSFYSLNEYYDNNNIKF